MNKSDWWKRERERLELEVIKVPNNPFYRTYWCFSFHTKKYHTNEANQLQSFDLWHRNTWSAFFRGACYAIGFAAVGASRHVRHIHCIHLWLDGLRGCEVPFYRHNALFRAKWVSGWKHVYMSPDVDSVWVNYCGWPLTQQHFWAIFNTKLLIKN